PDRLGYIRFAFQSGYTVEQIQDRTAIDAWFLEQIREVVDFESALKRVTPATVSREQLETAKRYGISDAQIARTWNVSELSVRARRKELGIRAVFNRVD